jgi:UDP-glucose 4-epimerase
LNRPVIKKASANKRMSLMDVSAKVLITGASGFVGGHLCRDLSKKGVHVVALSRQWYNDNLTCEQILLDLTDQLNVSDFIRSLKPDYIVHLAAVRPSEYRVAYEQNLLSSMNLIEACQHVPTLKRFIFLGSCEEYGQQPPPFEENNRAIPVSAYALSKLAVTQLLQAVADTHGFPGVIIRPSVVYGPGQSTTMFLPSMIQSLVLGQRFAMTEGEQTRDYLYISDLVNAIVNALFSDERINGEIINVSSGIPIRICDLARMTASLFNSKAIDKLEFGSKTYRLGEAMEYWADNQRAKVLLDWSPRISLEEGLLDTIAYFKMCIQQNLVH